MRNQGSAAMPLHQVRWMPVLQKLNYIAEEITTGFVYHINLSTV